MKTIFNRSKVLFTCVALFMATSCSVWEEYNVNPYGVTDEMLKADFNDIGAYFPQIQQSIYYNLNAGSWEFQLMQNLTADVWSGYMMSANPFNGNVNHTTLALNSGWCEYEWNYTYSKIMSPIFNSIEPLTKEAYPHFWAIAQVIRTMAMARVADAYGPIIFSAYGKSATGGDYDSVEAAYDQFFTEITQAINALTAYIDEYPGATPFANFDYFFNGDMIKWVQMASSLKLRLAMRIVKVSPAKAKAMAEEAMNSKYGVMESGYAGCKGAGYTQPLGDISGAWNDISMSAVMESLLLGYEDPRVGKFFKKATDKQVLDAGYEYKGIRMGVRLPSKDTYGGHSALNVSLTDPGIVMTAAEIWFLRAEGALRGWNGMGGTAQQLYENGIKASFAQWGLAGQAEAYIASTKLPAGYTDVKNPENSLSASSPYINKVPVLWDNGADNEIKLQQIMIQKYLAMWPEGYEAWSDQRRTGYPILMPVMVNESQGIFANTDNVKRVTYPQGERNNNPTGYQKALQLLGGEDNGNTKLWWDVDGPNF